MKKCRKNQASFLFWFSVPNSYSLHVPNQQRFAQLIQLTTLISLKIPPKCDSNWQGVQQNSMALVTAHRLSSFIQTVKPIFGILAIQLQYQAIGRLRRAPTKTLAPSFAFDTQIGRTIQSQRNLVAGGSAGQAQFFGRNMTALIEGDEFNLSSGRIPRSMPRGKVLSTSQLVKLIGRPIGGAFLYGE